MTKQSNILKFLEYLPGTNSSIRLSLKINGYLMIKLYCNTSDTDLVIGYVFSIMYTRHKTEIIKFERPCNEDFFQGHPDFRYFIEKSFNWEAHLISTGSWGDFSFALSEDPSVSGLAVYFVFTLSGFTLFALEFASLGQMWVFVVWVS